MGFWQLLNVIEEFIILCSIDIDTVNLSLNFFTIIFYFVLILKFCALQNCGRAGDTARLITLQLTCNYGVGEFLLWIDGAE